MKKRGDVEFSTLVKLIVAAVVLVILVLMAILFKDILWEKFDILKGIFR